MLTAFLGATGVLAILTLVPGPDPVPTWSELGRSELGPDVAIVTRRAVIRGRG
ncbi:hypothetical protein ACWGQT_04425 [Streptomyces yangpuensis]